MDLFTINVKDAGTPLLTIFWFHRISGSIAQTSRTQSAYPCDNWEHLPMLPIDEWRTIIVKISARNVLAGTVAGVTKGAVNAEVVLTLRGGETIVAVITNLSVDRLGLQPGTGAFAIIKASDVMVGIGLESAKLSARNIVAGKVAELNAGAVNSEVGIQLAGGTMLIASITKESVQALHLKQGDAVSAVVKASHVMVGV